MKIQDKIIKAKQLGTVAFKNGLTGVPFHDKNLMDLMIGLKMGEGGADIMKAYTKSFNLLNLAD